MTRGVERPLLANKPKLTLIWIELSRLGIKARKFFALQFGTRFLQALGIAQIIENKLPWNENRDSSIVDRE